MARQRKSLILVLCVVLVTSPIQACLWDYDTLAMERKRFPSTLELITGKFLRHSKAFYEWRVADRAKRIEQGESKPELYDDLAVAYDKLDRHEDAIKTILKKEELFPGLYETAANYGTFLIHSGKLEEGLVELDKAIAINPDAHFGREIYQKLVVEYVLEKKSGVPAVSPLGDEGILVLSGGFMAFLARKRKLPDGGEIIRKEAALARKGIEGMMKFGKYDSPILLEILGELLVAESRERASWLAARAYLKAEKTGATPLAPMPFRKRAEAAIYAKRERGDDSHAPQMLDDISSSLDKEVADADAWFAELSANEAKWIAAGLNADEEFSAMYYQDPISISGESIIPKIRKWLSRRSGIVFSIAAVLTIALLYRLVKRKPKPPTLEEELFL